MTNIILLVTFSMLFSFGKVNHDHHGWFFCFLVLCFFNYNIPLNQKRNFWLIRLMQGLFLLPYLISGCWKLKNIILNPPLSIAQLGLEHISYAIAQGEGPNDFMVSFFTRYPEIVTVGFLSVLLFQISCIFPIVTCRHFKKWALFCCLFHLSTGMTMGIWFRPNIALAIILLILTELLIEKEHTLVSFAKNKGLHFLSTEKL